MRIGAITNQTGAWKYYLNTSTVGANGNNQVRADVQLVQVILHHFYQAFPQEAAKLPATGVRTLTRGGAGFLIDGRVGPQTIVGIQVFQEFQRRSGHKTVENGSGQVGVVSLPAFIGRERFKDSNVNVWQIGVGGKAPAVTPKAASTSGLYDTIVTLNDYFFRYQGNILANGPYYNRLHDHPLIVQRAPELRAELARLEAA